jgi:hypothetical protein
MPKELIELPNALAQAMGCVSYFFSGLSIAASDFFHPGNLRAPNMYGQTLCDPRDGLTLK